MRTGLPQRLRLAARFAGRPRAGNFPTPGIKHPPARRAHSPALRASFQLPFENRTLSVSYSDPFPLCANISADLSKKILNFKNSPNPRPPQTRKAIPILRKCNLWPREADKIRKNAAPQPQPPNIEKPARRLSTKQARTASAPQIGERSQIPQSRPRLPIPMRQMRPTYHSDTRRTAPDDAQTAASPARLTAPEREAAPLPLFAEDFFWGLFPEAAA